MSRYTADGRRKSSMTHANRAHVCRECNRAFMGNGGWGSHKRANPDHHEMGLDEAYRTWESRHPVAPERRDG